MNTKYNRRNFIAIAAAGSVALTTTAVQAAKAKINQEAKPIALLLKRKNGDKLKANFFELTDGNILMEIATSSNDKRFFIVKPDLVKGEAEDLPKKIGDVIIEDLTPEVTAQGKKKGKGKFWKSIKKIIKAIKDTIDWVVDKLEKIIGIIKDFKEVFGNGGTPPFIDPTPPPY